MKFFLKMKVLQVSKLYFPYIGGVEKVVKDIAEGMQHNVYMEVLSCMEKGKRKIQVINGIRVIKASSLGIIWGMPISFTFPFILAWKSRKFDIIHFHLPFPLGVLSYLFLGSKKKKIVVIYHSDIVRQRKLMIFYKPFLYAFLKRAYKILVLSPNLIRSSSYLKQWKNKCCVIPFSIDIDNFVHFYDIGNRFGISPEEKIVLFVGRLAYYKGIEYLIKAMQDVEAKLLIVGEGKLREKLERLARFLNVDNKILFLGKLSDKMIKYCYQICDVFVLPSTESSEAFGIVQLEAMAYAKPVVNTNLPTGVTYVSIDGETGLTVPPKDSKALADAINKILTDERLASIFSQNARRRVKEKFSRKKMIESIYSIYQEALSGK